LNERMSALRRLMGENGVSNLFVSSLSDIYYLTGFTGSTAHLYLTETEAIFVTDSRYSEQSRTEVDEDIEVVVTRDYGRVLEKFALKAEKVHVTSACELSDYFMIKDNAEAVLEKKELISSLRMCKDDNEIDAIREMFHCAHKAFKKSLGFFKPGIKETEWAAELEKNMKVGGAKKPSFETIVASGARGAMPHGTASDKIIEKGEAVVVDFGGQKQYCSDVTRLVKTGEDEDVDRIADIVYTALCKAKDAVKTGVRCSEIDAVARDYITEKGYGDYFGHGLGHGVGIDVHEKPVFSPKDTTVLRENMVLTIEPGIYLPGRFGVRLEDTIVVKEDGCENLTAVFDEYIYKV